MISAWQMYWLSKLDAIGCTFFIFGVLGMLAMVVIAPMLLADGCISVKKAILSFVLFFFVFLLGCYAPLRKKWPPLL